MPKQKLTGQTAKKMIGEMSNTRTLIWVGVAFLVHVVVIGGTSYGYIRDRWIDPKGAEERKAAEVAADAEAAKAKAKAAAPTTPTATATPKPTGNKTEDERMMQEKKDNPQVKKVTEAAKPGEMPKAPSLDTLNLE